MLTILIPFFGKPEMMVDCIRHVHAADRGRNRLVLIDDGSDASDRSLVDRFLEGFPRDVHVIHHEQNRGYKEAIISGIAQVQDKYVLLLNNDTVVSLDFDLKLMAGLAESDHVKAVGPVSNHPTDLYQYREELAVDPENRPLGPEQVQRHFLANRSGTGGYVETPYLTGMCLLLETEIFRKAGQFGSAYLHGYFEDLALCCEIREMGFKLMVCEDCMVYHYGHATYRGRPKEEKHRIILNNFEIFRSSWGHLPSHPELLSKMAFAGKEDPI